MNRMFRSAIRMVLPSEGAVNALRTLRNEIKAARIAKRAAARFNGLRERTGLKVHLGCGYDLRPGWVNIDLLLGPSDRVNPRAHPDATFINYDLRLGLPLEPGSCELIYSSHFLEHLEYRHGINLLRACHEALRPGGRLRLCLPDFASVFRAYLANDREYFNLLSLAEVRPDVDPGTETLCDYVNYVAYQYGEHRCIYDQEKTTKLLRAMNFSSVVETGYDPALDPNDPLRRRYSFFLGAVK